MTDVEAGRARELVGRAGGQAPPMPEFDAIVARAGRHGELPSRLPRWRLMAFAAASLLVVSAGAVWWSLDGLDGEQIISGEVSSTPTTELEQDPEPSVEPSPAATEVWSREAWPGLVGVDDLELRLALGSPESADKLTSYTGPDRLRVNLQVLSGRGFEPQPGPQAEQVEVDGEPGWIERPADGRPASTSLTWARDGFQLFLTVNRLLTAGEVIAMAENVVPIVEEALPVAVTSPLLSNSGDPFVVATTPTSSGQLTLSASTADGFAFFMGFNSEVTPSLLTLNDFLTVSLGSTPEYQGITLHGLVDQAVASLQLRLSDGSTQDIEIQSRGLGYDVAFFLTIVEESSAATAIEAYGEDQALLESFDLTPFGDTRPTPPQAMVTHLLASVEEFVVDTLGWEISQVTIEEVDPGRTFVVTEPNTQSRLRVTMASDGTGIASVSPDPLNLTAAVNIAGNSVTLSFDGLDPQAASVTLYLATPFAQIQRTLSAAQFAERSITIDLRGLTDDSSLAYLLLFEDESGQVISAFSPG